MSISSSPLLKAASNAYACFPSYKPAKEEFLLVTDPGVPSSVQEAFFKVGRELFGTSFSQRMSEVPTTTAQPLGPQLGKAMCDAQAVLLLTSNSRTHSPETKNAVQSGTLVLSIPDAQVELLSQGAVLENIPALQKRVANCLQRYGGAQKVHLTTAIGTDLWIYLKSGTVDAEAGKVDEDHPIANFPCGEIMAVPQWKGTTGKLIVDGVGGCAEVGKPANLSHPITLEIVDGQVKEISGGDEAQAFQKQLEEQQAAYDASQPTHPGSAFALAEFAIGMNEAAWRHTSTGLQLPPTQLEAEKALGTVHLAVGNNALLLLQGKYGPEAPEFNPINTIHSDQVILSPTLEVFLSDGSSYFLLKNGLLS